MKTIDEHLKSGNFSHVYLLFGDEKYLVRHYKNALIKALVPDGDTMNFNTFSDDDIDENEIIQLANTLPFFSERRVIVINESNLLNHKTEALPDLISEMPDYLYMIFAESNVKKNLSLFNRIKKNGCIEECKKPKGRELQTWAVRYIKRQNINITKDAWELLATRASDSLDHMANEMDKLIDYCREKGAIELGDVEVLCSGSLEDRIFELIDAIAERDTAKVMKGYHDLNLLQKNVNQMLAAMYTSFTRMLMIKDMVAQRKSESDIASELGVHPFVVKKNGSLGRRFSDNELKALIADVCELEGAIRTGRIDQTVGFEALVIKYTNLK